MPDRVTEPDGAPIVWRCTRCGRLWSSSAAADYCCSGRDD